MDKINFENLPSTNTPVNAENLNGMQGKIEKSVNHISSSKPSTNEKVWFKKGKNLLDTVGLHSQTVYGVTISRNSDGTITLNGTATGTGNVVLLTKINVIISGDNTFSARKVSGSIGSSSAIRFSINNSSSSSSTSTDARIFTAVLSSTADTDSNTVNTSVEMYYLSCYINSGAVFNNFKVSLQVESGTSATPYEKYLNKEILVKNDNGEFERFAKVDETDKKNVSDMIPTSINIDNETNAGMYMVAPWTAGTMPTSIGGNSFLVIVGNTNALYNVQMAIGFGSAKIAIRTKSNSSSWSNWKYVTLS